MQTRNFFVSCLLIAMAPVAVCGAELFLPHQELDLSGSANDVAIGDIDQDGLPDIAVASNGVAIYINDAQGEYEKRQRIRVDNDTVNKVGLADLDLDGDLDLIAARNGSPIEIYWNDGTGTYDDEGYLFSAEYSAPTDMFVVDTNHDGAADILTQNINARPKVFLNDGNGGFPASSKTLLDSRHEETIEIANIDGDGNPDLVTWDGYGSIKFHLGNGDAAFEHDPSADVESEDLFSFVVGDINGDARDDLLLVEFEGIRLLVNSASGQMSPRKLDLGITPKDISAIALADTNSDGYDDLILSLSRLENLLYINNREENFVRSPTNLGGKNDYVTEISTLDINGDRDNDILFSSRQLTLYSNTSLSPSDQARRTPPGIRRQVSQEQRANRRRIAFADAVAINQQQRIERFELADINGDNLADVVALTVSNHNPVFSFFLNKGGGTLDSHGSLQGPARQEIGDILFADIDSDGDPDLLIGWLDQYITIHRNDGRGTFDAAGQALSKSNIRTSSLTTGFVNNDAHLDIVATGNRTQIHFNTGDGSFITDHMSGLPTEAGSDVSLADLDKDGDLDLLISSDEIMIYYNRGNGSFGIPGTELFNPNEYARQLFVFDIDSDGDLDLLAGGGGTYAFINEGQGKFAEPSHLSSLYSLALGDLEGDGDVDIVSYRRGIRSTVLTNDGRGGWIPDSKAVIAGGPGILRLADFDGDGDPDIIAAGRNRNHLVFYENLGLSQPKLSATQETPTQPGKLVDENAPGLSNADNTSEIDTSRILSTIPWRNALFALGLLLLIVLTFRLLFS